MLTFVVVVVVIGGGGGVLSVRQRNKLFHFGEDFCGECNNNWFPQSQNSVYYKVQSYIYWQVSRPFLCISVGQKNEAQGKPSSTSP